MSIISLLEATCCGVPILRHIPTYTDSDTFYENKMYFLTILYTCILIVVKHYNFNSHNYSVTKFSLLLFCPVRVVHC